MNLQKSFKIGSIRFFIVPARAKRPPVPKRAIASEGLNHTRLTTLTLLVGCDFAFALYGKRFIFYGCISSLTLMHAEAGKPP